MKKINKKYYEIMRQADNAVGRKEVVSLLKNKFILLYNSDSLVSSLPNNFKYIPKIKFQIGQ